VEDEESGSDELKGARSGSFGTKGARSSAYFSLYIPFTT